MRCNASLRNKGVVLLADLVCFAVRREQQHASRVSRSIGFTLLEMLVVLMIAGLLISLASLSLTRNPRADLIEEAQRLAFLLEIADDEAQLRGQLIAWKPLNNGFRFDVRSEKKWQPLYDDLLGPRHWKSGVVGVLIRYHGMNLNADRLFFGTESIDIPVQITLFSSLGSATIMGTGCGRYEVH